MSSFKIDLKTVEQLRSRHSRLSSSLSNAANQLSSAAYGVDPAIKARRQLQYRISYATQRLRELEDRMYNISDFIRKAIEQYDSAEGQIKSKVGEITGRHRRSWLENLFDGVGDAYNALTQWLASEDGQRFTEQAKANAVPPANSCPAPEEPIDYRAYLGEYDRDTPGVDALYFIDPDGNRMQVDFSKLEQLVGEYYYVSNLMLIPGQVMDLREADFTDFYIYAIKQGYDPRTFQPIDAADAENIQNYINGRIQTYEMYRQKQKVIGSLMLDLLPVIGQVKSAIEIATGENLVTGEELNGWDYGFGIAGAIAPAIKGGRGLYKGYKALSAVDEAVDVGRVIGVAGKLTDTQIETYLMKATQNPESDQFILGVTGSYDIMADKLGYTYFKMSDEVWDDLVENANKDYDEIWRVNEKFIKEQISAGKEILLSNNPFEKYLFDDGSKRFFQRELDYLTESGYIFSETSDGMWKATIGLIRSE